MGLNFIFSYDLTGYKMSIFFIIFFIIVFNLLKRIFYFQTMEDKENLVHFNTM